MFLNEKHRRLSLSKEEVNQFLEKYNLGTVKDSTTINEGYSNTNIRVRTDLGTYVLKVFGSDEKSECEREARVNSFAYENGASAPQVYHTKEGGILSKEGKRYGAIIEAVNGKNPSFGDETDKNLFKIGQSLGKLDHILTTYKNQEGIPWLEDRLWDELLNEASKGDSEYDLFERTFDEVKTSMVNLKSNCRKSVVHADMVRGNILVNPEGIRIIDFGDAHTDYVSTDLANAITHLCFKEQRTGSEFERVNVDALISGYKSSFILSTEEKQAVYPLGLFRAVAFRLYYGHLLRGGVYDNVEFCKRQMDRSKIWINAWKQTSSEEIVSFLESQK